MTEAKKPLKTPELVSDHSIKRRLSCESSSDDEISDSESNDKRAQKKFRVDNKKSIKINDDKRNDVEEEEVQPSAFPTFQELPAARQDRRQRIFTQMEVD